MLAWLLAWWRAKQPAQREVAASAAGLSVAISGDNTNSPIQIGLDEDEVGRVLEEKLDRKLAEISRAKGVPEAPLREVLKRLGETEVAETEIPDRLAKAADELHPPSRRSRAASQRPAGIRRHPRPRLGGDRQGRFRRCSRAP